MGDFLGKFHALFGAESTIRTSPARQGIFHVAAVYAVALVFIPALVGLLYGSLVQFLVGHRLGGNPLQFLFSHLLVLSVLPGFIAGFVNARLFNRAIVRFVWLVPFAVLLYRFVFTAPGIYPTMLWDSDFRQAFHYFFGGGFKIVGEWRNYRELRTLFLQNMGDLLRGYTQYRWTVPAYVGVAYSLGASLSLRINGIRTQASNIQETAAQVASGT
jgi:hypothetical protein